MHFARSIVQGYHSIPKIKWRSFRGRYHFGVDLGIISGLGITSGSGSFRGVYRIRALDYLGTNNKFGHRQDIT